MIDQLFDEERQYGGPAACQMTGQIAKLRETLHNQMDSTETTLLEQLEALYIRQNSLMLRDAYSSGFSAAVKLLLEAVSSPP